MFSPSNRLDDRDASVIADTSALINLIASGQVTEILRALPNRCCVTEQVVKELMRGQIKGHDSLRWLNVQVADGRVDLVKLSRAAERDYNALVAGTRARRLGDGELATIAYASYAGGIALTDDRKAVEIASERFPHLLVASSVEVFAQRRVRASLGDEALRQAVIGALKRGRMRVQNSWVAWVVDLIGVESALECPSLFAQLRSG